MALAANTFTGNGGVGPYSISWPYISQNHVEVLINGIVVGRTFITSSSIQLSSPAANGAAGIIRRVTPSASPMVDWANGANINEENLDLATLQTLYRMQEIEDLFQAEIGAATNDAVLLAQNAAEDAQTAATAAAASASAASTSATNAATSATAAQTAETNAETAETNAETAEANAETAATAAAASATAAAGSATAAAASATAAANSAASAPVPPGFVSIRIQNNSGDANNDIDFLAGMARDSTNVDNIVLSATLTKRLDASWAVGSGNGGLDTGSKANSTFYYLWAIKRSDTLVSDALFSTSATAPTMPANYDRKQRVGWVLTDGSGNIMAFKQSPHNLDWLRFVTSLKDIDVTNLGTSRVLYTLTLPGSCIVELRLNTTNASSSGIVLQPTQEADAAPSVSATPGTSLRIAAGTVTAGHFLIEADSSKQIAARSESANTTLRAWTLGAIFKAGIIP